MKVLLVNPPAKQRLPSILPASVEESRGRFPALGILYLAAALLKAGVETAVIDAPAEGLTAEEVARRTAAGGYDLVGITVMTFSLLDALETAAAIKAARPPTVVAAGGPHPYLYPAETLALGPFDLLVRGEGEESFFRLVREWPESRGAPLPGVWWKEGSKGDPDPAPFIFDLDRLPFPARSLTSLSLYYSVLSGLRPITTMMSSRGCPHRCTFCDRPHLGKRFRSRSAANVLAEMKECAELGVKEIIFYDDTFSLDRERVVELCELILSTGLTLPWDIRARVSDLKPADYLLARRAGLTRLHFGVETGDPELLRSLRKGITIPQAREAFTAARSAGIETLAYFMIGLPGETLATLDRTLALARELDPDYVHFSLFIPFPGTPLYQQALEKGVLRHDVWAEFARDPRPDFVPPVWEETLTAAELTAALRRMYKVFYSQPRVLWRRLRRARSVRGFLRSARMGLRIFRLGEKAS